MAIKKDIQEKTLKQIIDMFGCYGAYYVYKRDNYISLCQEMKKECIIIKKYTDIKNNKIRMEDIILLKLLNENIQQEVYKEAIYRAKIVYETESKKHNK